MGSEELWVEIRTQREMFKMGIRCLLPKASGQDAGVLTGAIQ